MSVNITNYYFPKVYKNNIKVVLPGTAVLEYTCNLKGYRTFTVLD